MKIEYIEAWGDYLPVALIWGNEPAKALLLREVVRKLAQGEIERAAIHELPGFEAVDGCQLFFSAGKHSRGGRLVSPPRVLEFHLQPRWWDNIEYLLKSFCEPKETEGLQDLDVGFYTDVRLVMSRDRDW